MIIVLEIGALEAQGLKSLLHLDVNSKPIP